MDLALHREQVAHALNELEAKLERLVEALAHGAAAVDIEPSRTSDAPIRRICEAYSQINYRMDEQVGSSVVCLGVAGISAEILRKADAVNAAKAKLKAVCSPLQGISTRIPVKGESSPTKAIPVIRVILRNIQRSDLSLFAAYRKIPILGAPPVSITYTRANTRSVYRKSIDELYELLNNSEGPMASADRARLATLNRGETHLALVKEHYKNIRANVLYSRLDARGRGRIQIAAELPLLYAKGRRAEPPLVQFPSADAAAEPPRRVRKSKLEAAPFLQSIPVYRYSLSTSAPPHPNR
jgi:hypothetical protein